MDLITQQYNCNQRTLKCTKRPTGVAPPKPQPRKHFPSITLIIKCRMLVTSANQASDILTLFVLVWFVSFCFVLFCFVLGSTFFSMMVSCQILIVCFLVFLFILVFYRCINLFYGGFCTPVIIFFLKPCTAVPFISWYRFVCRHTIFFKKTMGLLER